MEYKDVQKVYSVSFDEKELKQIIEKYFLNKTNKGVKFTTKTTKETQGCYANESEYVKTKYYLEQEVIIAGITKNAEMELLEEDIKQILKEVFTQYKIIYISFKSGFDYQTQYEFKTPVFKEVKVSFVQIEKEKIHGLNSILNITEPPLDRTQSMYDPRNKGGYYEDWSLCRKF